MIINKICKCESCGKDRVYKYNTNTNKIYQYKPMCKTCTLIKRNKSQNFSKRKYPIIDLFEKIDTQEKAYIFGFIWADGCLMEAKRKNIASVKSLTICMNSKDKEILDFIIKNFGGSYKEKIVYDKRTNKKYNQAYWQLNSKDVYNNFINLNFRINSFSIPNHLFNHFLRGLIDGDGSFRLRKNKIEIKITSNFDQNWSFITSRINFKYSIKQYKYKDRSYSDLNILGDKIEFLKWLYKDATFFLKRKYDIVKDKL